MKIVEPHYIVFDLDKYENESQLWEDIHHVTEILSRNDYVAMISYEDCGLYNLSFVPIDESLGDNVFVTVTPEEKENILIMRQNDCCDEEKM